MISRWSISSGWLPVLEIAAPKCHNHHQGTQQKYHERCSTHKRQRRKMQPPHNSDLTKVSPSSRSLEGFCRIPILSEVERVHFRPHWVKPKVPPLLATAYFTFLSNKRILKCQMSSYSRYISYQSQIISWGRLGGWLLHAGSCNLFTILPLQPIAMGARVQATAFALHCFSLLHYSSINITWYTLQLTNMCF